MALEYCIELKEGSVCVPIPAQIFPWPWWMQILYRFDDPEPSPWVVDEQLDEIQQRDLAVLAAIQQLSQELSLSTRRQMQRNLKQTVEKLELPNGRKVVFR